MGISKECPAISQMRERLGVSSPRFTLLPGRNAWRYPFRINLSMFDVSLYPCCSLAAGGGAVYTNKSVLVHRRILLTGCCASVTAAARDPRRGDLCVASTASASHARPYAPHAREGASVAILEAAWKRARGRPRILRHHRHIAIASQSTTEHRSPGKARTPPPPQHHRVHKRPPGRPRAVPA